MVKKYLLVLLLVSPLWGYKMIQIPGGNQISCIKFYKKNQLFLGLDLKKIIIYDFEKSREIYCFKSPQLYFPISIDYYQNFIFTNSLINGKNYLLTIDMTTSKLLHRPILHQKGNKNIFYCKPDNSIIVCQSHFTKYNKYQKKWDSNTMNPDAQEILAWKKFYDNERAYTLVKYSNNFELIDSCDFIERTGENYKAYEIFNSMESYDMDFENNIYVFHGSTGYSIRKYSWDFRLLKKIDGKNSDFKPLPPKMAVEQAKRINSIEKSYSQVGKIFGLENNIFVFYSDNQTNKSPRKKYFYDIYDQKGNLLHSGISNYYFCTKDFQNNIYIYVKSSRRSFFKKPSDTLIGFSIEELIKNDITFNYIEKILGSDK